MEMNPDIVKDLRQLTVHKYEEMKRRQLEDDEAKEKEYNEMANLNILFVMVALLRQRDQRTSPMLSVCLSILAYKVKLHDTFWSLFTKVKLLMAWSTVKILLDKLTPRILSTIHPSKSKSVGFTVADNKSYHIKRTFNHADDDGESDAGNYLHTVNRFSEPILSYIELGVFRSWHDGSDPLKSLPLFIDHAGHERRLNSFWNHFVSTRGSTNVLSRPVYDPTDRTPIIYREPVFDVSTGAYHDVELWLSRIHYEEVTVGGHELVFVVGDQQTYKRMIDLKREKTEKYAWLVPKPGEFHFRVHVDFALNILLWVSLLCKLVAHLGWEKTIRPNEGSVERADHYDVFFQLIVKAALVYLEEVVPAHVLANYNWLIDAVSENKGAVVLIRVLKEFLLPRMALRMAVRSNVSSVIDWMWVFTNPWFRATNKFNYAVMTVDYTQIRCSLVDPLRLIWNNQRTVSLSGNRGSNIEHDRAMEKFNLCCAEFTRHHVSREALSSFCRNFNALSWVEDRFLKAISMDSDGTTTYNHVLEDDVTAVVAYLKSNIGATWDELTSARASSLGGSAADVPWETIRKYREGVGSRQSTQEYVTEKLSNPVVK